MSRAITANIDVIPRGVPPVISVSQYDTDFTIVFSLYSSGGDLTIASGTTAAVSGTKPDGTGYSADCTINTTAKTVTVTGAAQMTAAAGRAIFELALFKSSKRLSTSNFILDVEPAAMDADTVISETEINRFVGLEDSITGYVDAAQTAASNASASASSASTYASNASSSATAAASSASSAASAAQAERRKYASSNSSGVIFAKMDGGTTYTPTNVPDTLTNIYEDADGVHVRKGTTAKHTITTDGNTKMAVDANAASTSADGSLYTALSNLSWTDAISSGFLSLKNLFTKILTLLKTHDTKLGYASDVLNHGSGTYTQNNYVAESAYNDKVVLYQFRGTCYGILRVNLNISQNLPSKTNVIIGTLPVLPTFAILHTIPPTQMSKSPVFMDIERTGENAGKIMLYCFDTTPATTGWYRASIPAILPYATEVSGTM